MGSGGVNITSAGPINATAPNFNLTGNVYVTGTISATDGVYVTGTISATGDVIGGGISLDNHIHPDAQGGNTGAPQ